MGAEIALKPATCYLAVDTVLLTREGDILLIRRRNDPYRDSWALPGGFVDPEERIRDAVERELREETGVQDVPLEEFRAYGDPGRDPRGRVVSFVFIARIQNKLKAVAGDDAKECGWFSIRNLPELAFDHETILEDVREYLNEKDGRE